MKNVLQSILVSIIIVSSCFMFGACDGGGKPHIKGKVVQTKDTPKHISVNVYVENSGSMDGYVKGITEFKQSVYNYLCDIKISEICDSLNLYYVNSQIIPYSTKSRDEVSDFIQKLDPTTFRQRGGNRGTSDIAQIVEMIADGINEQTISILISDCIFSPGNSINADGYLINQQIGIKRIVAQLLKKGNYSTVIYRLTSAFDGIYYNKVDKKISLVKEERPFYIWVLGEQKTVAYLTDKIKETSFKGSGVKNSFTLVKCVPEELDYAILRSPKIGRFEKSKSKGETKTHIVNAEVSDKGVKKGFMVAVGVDYSSLPLNDEYLLNADNYEISDNTYTLQVEKSDKAEDKYTHRLLLSLDNKLKYVPKSVISVKLKNRLPDWVGECNDELGDEPVRDKTYGIRNLIEGFYDAYTLDKQEVITEFKLHIN